MYNNEITYDKKWDTQENNQAQKELEDLALKATACWSDCPLSWSVEVLALVKEIIEKYGDKVKFDQIKEKFGELRVYFSAESNEIDQAVDALICKTELALARKGAYYPVEDLANSVTTRYIDGNQVKTYPYREFLTLDEIASIKLVDKKD